MVPFLVICVFVGLVGLNSGSLNEHGPGHSLGSSYTVDAFHCSPLVFLKEGILTYSIKA